MNLAKTMFPTAYKAALGEPDREEVKELEAEIVRLTKENEELKEWQSLTSPAHPRNEGQEG